MIISALAWSSCAGTSFSSPSWIFFATASTWVRSASEIVPQVLASTTVAPASGPTPMSSMCGTLRYHWKASVASGVDGTASSSPVISPLCTSENGSGRGLKPLAL